MVSVDLVLQVKEGIEELHYRWQKNKDVWVRVKAAADKEWSGVAARIDEVDKRRAVLKEKWEIPKAKLEERPVRPRMVVKGVRVPPLSEVCFSPIQTDMDGVLVTKIVTFTSVVACDTSMGSLSPT